MDSIRSVLTCKYCNNIYSDPIYLPCHKTMCRHHVDELRKENKIASIKCVFCKNEHEIPLKGFEKNEMALGFLNSRISVSKQVSELKVELDKAFDEASDVIKEFEKEQKQIELFAVDHFLGIKNKIDSQKDSVKLQIEKIAEKLKHEIDECESIYKEKIKSFKAEEILSKDKLKKLSSSNEELKKSKLSEINNCINRLRFKKYELIDIKSKIESCSIDTRVSTNLRREAFGELKLVNNYALINGLSLIFASSSEFGFKSEKRNSSFSNAVNNEYKFLTAANDNSIKLWNSKTGMCLNTLNEHRAAVTCLQMLSNDEIISGSLDNTIKIWNLNIEKKGFCTNTLISHSGAVLCLCLSANEKILSGSEDKTIKIWTRDGQLKNTLTGHKGSVNAIKLFFSYGKLISGSSDFTIKIWGLISGSCLNTLNGHSGAVLCLQLLPTGELCSGSSDSSIKVWSLESGLNAFIECKKSSLNVYDAHKGPVKGLKLLSDDKLVSCSEDQTIKVWDIKNGFCLFTLNSCHSGSINCIELLPNDVLVSVSSDKCIKMWNLKNGQCLNTLTGHTGEIEAILNVEKRSFKFLNNIFN